MRFAILFLAVWLTSLFGLTCPVWGEKNKQVTTDQFTELKEIWSGSLYSSTYRAGLCIAADGKVRGVLHLRLSDGKIDEYHFYGHIKDDRIEVSHSSGHVFKGRLMARDVVEGDVSLKNGMTVHLKGKRSHDVRLAPTNCAPLTNSNPLDFD